MPQVRFLAEAGRSRPDALFLAGDIGNLERMMQMTIPLGWNEQRETLGWPAAR